MDQNQSNDYVDDATASTSNVEQVTETMSTEETPVQKEEVSDVIPDNDRHDAASEIQSEKAYDEKQQEDTILFPTSTYKAVSKLIEAISEIDDDKFKDEYSTQEAMATGITIESMRTTTAKGIFDDKLNSKIENIVNCIKYADKDLNMRPLKVDHKEGALSGQTAVARFTSLLGIGEVIQIPLWHSGFWITIKPPKGNELINLEMAIGNNEILLGRETNTLVYSNYSVVFNRIVTNFIIEHLVSSSLKLPAGDDIRSYISTQDLYPMVLGLLTTMYPDGINVTRSCINNTVMTEEKKPVCDFIVSAKLDTKKLLWLDRKKLSKSMLETMSKRAPNSVSVNEVKEYKMSIKDIADKVVSLKTTNGTDIKITLSVPQLDDYIINGEQWVQNVISKSEELFTDADSQEVKNNKVNEILMSVIFGIYNVFVTEINENGAIISDRDTIDEILSVISSDYELFNTFIKEVENYITQSAIAIVATQNYTCPKCKAEQTSKAVGQRFEEFIPLNILETFFDLSVLRLNKLRNREIF